ncbi:hypothetical protein ACFX11_038336 [Malus domestica]
MLDMRSQTVQLFGYHDKKNEWYPVKGSTGFAGRAVVVGETLYAVALSHNLVIAFSFGKCGGEDGTGQSLYLADIQHIGVTTFEIVDDGEEGNPMINTLHSTVYAVDTSDLDIFDIDFGFAT